jgi:hypothetical protein
MCANCGLPSLVHDVSTAQDAWSNASSKPVFTNDQVIKQLITLSRWTTQTITFAFPTSGEWVSTYFDISGFSPFNSAQQTAARQTIKLWDDLIAPNFVETSNAQQANIKYSNTTGDFYAFATYPGDFPSHGNVWMNSDENSLINPTSGQLGYMVFLHETGHAIGLRHPGNYDASIGATTYENDAIYRQDSHQYSVMSYFNASETGSDWVASDGIEYYAQTPMLHDILAIQAMYGASTTTRTGNTTYGFNSSADVSVFNFAFNRHPIVTIYDSSGIDTLDLSGWNTSCSINLTPGSFSSADQMTNNIAIAFSCIIENARGGGGSDSIIGNEGDNLVEGLGGSDTLSGGLGSDSLIGGSGWDTAVYGVASTAAAWSLNADGTWTINAGVEGSDRLNGIEVLRFSDKTVSLKPGGPGTKFFSPTSAPLVVANFTPGAGGWTSQEIFPRNIGDVNGDGHGDILGSGYAGVWVALGSAGGSFAKPELRLSNLGQVQGWTSQDAFARTVADVNGDGNDDLVGFGIAGTWVALANGLGGFDPARLAVRNFGQQQGWISDDQFARRLGDVNGDGYDDIVGFGIKGVLVSLADGQGGFAAPVYTLDNFVQGKGWTSDDRYHRDLGDVNGDGRADIVGFGEKGTWVALADGAGSFTNPFFALANFGRSQGWTSQDVFKRELADVNGDGVSDIVGFGNAGTYVALADGAGGFGPASFDTSLFGLTDGWSSNKTFHRAVADMNKDGYADIVGFGQAGVLLATSEPKFG